MEAVHIPSWLPLARLSLYPQNQVGEWGNTLSQLQQLNVPLSPCFVIPVQTFQDIADDNDLAEKLAKLQQKEFDSDSSRRQQVAKLFLNLKFPSDTAHDLLRAYHEVVGKSLAEVRFSPVQPFTGSEELLLSCIDGDTNTIDSILQLWTESYLLSDTLVPGAMVVRQNLQPASSGIAFTKDLETETKTQVVLLSTWGAAPIRPNFAGYDQFKVDVRTWNTLFSQIAEKSHRYLCQPDQLTETSVTTELQHSPSLSEAQVEDLAKLIHLIKLHTLHHSQIGWELVHNRLVITSVTSLESHHQTEGLPHPHAAVVTGTPVVPGVVEGICYLDLPGAGPQALPSQAVLVLKQFTPQVKPYLNRISALVVERPLPDFAHQLLQQLHIPTLSMVLGAQRFLRQGQTVIVDATNGHIFTSQTNHLTPPTLGSTLAKVWVTASNPDKAPEVLNTAVDGVVFNSSLTFAKFGEHPLFLVKSQRREALLQELVHTLEAFKPKHQFPLLYKPVEITHSGNYEKLEPNPYLGYRGSLRLGHSFEVFDTELEALNEIVDRNHQRLGLVIPLARTSAELRTVINHLQHQTQIPLSKLDLWWQICTPENLTHLEHYVSSQLTGVIVSVKDLHSLMHGIDPSNPDVYARYPVNVTLMRDLIMSVAKTCPQHQILIQIDDEYSRLSDVAVELRLAGVIVKPAQALKTKQLLLEEEHQQLN